MVKAKREREPWHLTQADFHQPEVYARQDWRYQMFFVYLRLSPSYALALGCDTEAALAEVLGDAERAALVWRTKMDMGDVHATVYKAWWNHHGLQAFGAHAQRPAVLPLTHLPPNQSSQGIQQRAGETLDRFLNDRYEKQGRPDSVLVSIPLAQATSITVRQLKRVLANIRSKYDPIEPVAEYQLVKNKMRMSRLKTGYRLLLHRAANPEQELWRAATNAKISKSHSGLDPKSAKKSVADAQARRMLTIMASRLYRETLMISENAAMGKFPSLDPVQIVEFDLRELGRRLKETFALERAIEAQMKLDAESLKQEPL